MAQPSSRRSCGSGALLATLLCVADVEQNLEVELFAAIGEVERRHLRLVTGGLRAFERLTIHLVEVGEDALAGAGHRDLLEGLGGQPRDVAIGVRLVRARIEMFLEELARCADDEAARLN